jgi:PIN domain nuclease of toxin-antitoxin system
MAALIYLDTHVLAWLYAARVDLLSQRASELIESSELLISPMVLMELEYLHEIDRLRVGSHAVLGSLHAQIGVRVCDLEFPKVVRAALQQRWTRDPFDRLLVGQASLGEHLLLTRDESIHRHYPHATW